MNHIIPIKDKEGWFKSSETGAIQCADTARYQKFMKGYSSELEKEKQMVALQNDVSGLKSELGEIKTLLLTLANKQND